MRATTPRERGEQADFIHLVSSAAAEGDAWRSSLGAALDPEAFKAKRALVHEWIEKGERARCEEGGQGQPRVPARSLTRSSLQSLCSPHPNCFLRSPSTAPISPLAGHTDVLRKALSLAPLCIRAPEE